MTRLELQPALTVGAWSVRAIVQHRRSIIDTPVGCAATLGIEPIAILFEGNVASQILSLDGACVSVDDAYTLFPELCALLHQDYSIAERSQRSIDPDQLPPEPS